MITSIPWIRCQIITFIIAEHGAFVQKEAKYPGTGGFRDVLNVTGNGILRQSFSCFTGAAMVKCRKMQRQEDRR